MYRSPLRLIFRFLGFAVATLAICFPARAQNPAETTPPEHKRTDPQQATPEQAPAAKAADHRGTQRQRNAGVRRTGHI
jgi:hypothetical protein